VSNSGLAYYLTDTEATWATYLGTGKVLAEKTDASTPVSEGDLDVTVGALLCNFYDDKLTEINSILRGSKAVPGPFIVGDSTQAISRVAINKDDLGYAELVWRNESNDRWILREFSDEHLYLQRHNSSGTFVEHAVWFNSTDSTAHFGASVYLDATSPTLFIGSAQETQITKSSGIYADNVTDGTNKGFIHYARPYTNADGNWVYMWTTANSGNNVLRLGGHTSIDSSTLIELYTATALNTVGTLRTTWDTAGLITHTANIYQSAASPLLTMGAATGSPIVQLQKSASGSSAIQHLAGTSAALNDKRWRHNSSENLVGEHHDGSNWLEVLRLDNSRNVTFPATSVQVLAGDGTGNPEIGVSKSDAGSGVVVWYTAAASNTGSKRMRLGSTELMEFEHYNGSSWASVVQFSDVYVNLKNASALLYVGDGTGSPEMFLRKSTSGYSLINMYAGTSPAANDKRIHHDASEQFLVQHYTGSAWQDIFYTSAAGTSFYMGSAVTNAYYNAPSAAVYAGDSTGSPAFIARKSDAGNCGYKMSTSVVRAYLVLDSGEFYETQIYDSTGVYQYTPFRAGPTSSSTSNGETTTVRGGPGGSTSGDGGQLSLLGGTVTSGAGGPVVMQGADGVGTNKVGGDVRVYPGAGTGTARNGGVQSKRLHLDGGSSLVAGDFSLSAGWGDTASVSVTAGSKDERWEITITPAGTGISANPTVTLTFKNGAWIGTPFAYVLFNGATGGASAPGQPLVTTISTTALTFQHVGTPVTTGTYKYICFVLG
jgi:hypothetical protein